jgi:DNA repair protein RecO (recombination protein O)
MNRIEPALVVALHAHGEHGVVGRFLSAGSGLVAAYVHGGRGRALRPVLQLGNQVALDITPRRAGQLPVAVVHALSSNMAMLHGPAAIALVEHVCGLAAATLPEGEPQPRLFPLVAALLAAAGAGADRLALGAALVRLELTLLAELGLGLDLGSCAATGTTDDLAFVSPRSRQAVCRAAGLPHAGKLLPLPGFLASGGPADAAALAGGLRLSGHFLFRDLLAGNPAETRLHAGRDRLVGLLLAPMQPPG